MGRELLERRAEEKKADSVSLSDFSSIRWVTLQLLWSCNLRCIMCDHPHKPRSEMSIETVNDVLAQLTHKVRLSFIGGEPCLWLMKRQDVMRQALKNGHVVHMITNGMLVPHITDYVDAFRDREVSVQFSVDGYAESYERIRQRASWQTLVDTIRLLQSRRREGGNKRSSMTVNVVVMRSNLVDILKLVRFCAQEGIDGMNITYGIIYDSMVKRGTITEDESVYFCKEETDDAIDKAIEVAQQLGFSLQAPAPLCDLRTHAIRNFGNPASISPPGRSPIPNGGDVPCFRPWREIWINQDGSVQPCCCGSNGPKIGFVKDGIANIWNSEIMQEVRNELANQRFHGSCRCGANMFGVYRRSGPEHFLTRVREEKKRNDLRQVGANKPYAS